MGAGATGQLDGEVVVVADVAQANRLHNKAQAGTPQPGNALHLSLVEAAHCMASGWLEVPGIASATHLLARSPNPQRALTDAFVYGDLRTRGLVVRPGQTPHQFDVWPRGTGTGPLLFQTTACSVNDPLGAAQLLGAGSGVLSVVDDDNIVTHYQVQAEEPAGKVPADDPPHAAGFVVADRVLVTDEAACAAYAKQHIGTVQAAGRLLSPLEVATLHALGVLRVEGRVPPSRRETEATVLALRQRGVVAKSGLRFGSDLRAYADAPDDTHADWLIQCVGKDAEIAWSDLARGVRLAHGVRKKFLVAIFEGSVRFVHLAWLRV